MELRHLRIGNDDAVTAVPTKAERLAVEHLASAVCLEHRYDGEDDPGRFGYDDIVTRPGYQRVLREEILSPAYSCNVSLPLRAFNVSSDAPYDGTDRCGTVSAVLRALSVATSFIDRHLTCVGRSSTLKKAAFDRFSPPENVPTYNPERFPRSPRIASHQYEVFTHMGRRM